jgi:hypothetical protein
LRSKERKGKKKHREKEPARERERERPEIGQHFAVITRQSMWDLTTRKTM